MLKYRLFLISFILFFVCIQPLHAQISSVLNEGNWYRLGITKDGIYQVSGADLQEQGIDLSSIDPNQIGIYGYGGGMLPQSLSENRFSDLPQNRILILGAEDGQLQADDQIIFFARGPDYAAFQPEEPGEFKISYQKNLYADTAYYFLSLSQGSAHFVETRSTQTLVNEPITIFDDFLVHENDLYNILAPGSGREWYGENFYNGDRLSLDPLPEGIVKGSTLDVEIAALGRTTSPSTLEVGTPNGPLGEITLPPILGGTYTEKGKEASATFETSVVDEAPLINLQYRATDGRGRAHLNRALLRFARHLALYEEQTFFRSVASASENIAGYRIASASQDAVIWDVTNPLNPVLQEAIYQDDAWLFSTASSDRLHEYVIFDPARIPAPAWEGEEPEHRLPVLEVPDLLIITPAALRPAAERLAKLRRSHDQLEVAVATTEAVYRQYASGRQDVSAIRNYAKDLYDAEPGKLKYLLLFGKASYDYKNRIDGNINLVPTYQSRNSTHPIYSYPSDDYFGFLEDDEGYWEESFSGDHTLDIGLGRLPVKNLQEAGQMVDKLEHYATSQQGLGDWRTFVTFLADDGDNDRYQKDSELLAAQVNQNIQSVNTRKIYLDAYEQERFPNQEVAPAVNQAIEETIEKGTLLFNYVGHGNEQRLADENVLNVGMISRWKNLDRMPFFVTATCEFGRYDDPERISGAERLVLLPEGGAVGMVTTARPVFSNTNYLLNRSFYRYVFAREAGTFLRIGDVFRKTKNDALNGRDNRNFTLLADPSMRLAYPRHQIVIDSILSLNAQMSTDTVRAMEEVRIFGRIVCDNGKDRLESFEGELSLVLHDKALEVQTQGNEGTVMQFKESENVINRVRARVVQGMFSVDLLVPQNINYKKAQGRISMYALEPNALTDAFGGLDSLYVGGSLPDVLRDTQGPQIQLFINDTTFQDGGISGPEPTLIAHFRDQQGINLSRQQAGHEILAILKRVDREISDRTLLLNDFYRPQLNNFRLGHLQYPLGSLEEGKYMLTLYAWDTHNNSSETSVVFQVTDRKKLLIQNFSSYPNPFSEATTFTLEHNRAGEHLRVLLSLFDMQGNQLFQMEKDFQSASGRLEITNWLLENGISATLSPGVYLASVRLRAQEDGQEDIQSLRIIVTN